MQYIMHTHLDELAIVPAPVSVPFRGKKFRCPLAHCRCECLHFGVFSANGGPHQSNNVANTTATATEGSTKRQANGGIYTALLRRHR